MRRVYASVLPVAALLLVATTSQAQVESSREVAGGGISVNGWAGMVDPGEVRPGQALTNAKLANDEGLVSGLTVTKP